MSVGKQVQFSPGEAEAEKPVLPDVLLKNKTFHAGMFDRKCLSSLASSLSARSLLG